MSMVDSTEIAISRREPIAVLGMKVLVVGGAGAFGSFYAKLLSKNGFDVSISDIDSASGKAFCKENGFGWVKPDGEMSGFDIVIVSVPNNAAPAVIRKIAPLLSKGSLLADFCSVKEPVVKQLSKHGKLGIELASIHPIHGPRVGRIAGYPVVCIAVKPGPKLEAMKQFFEKNGASFFFSAAKEHDKCLSIVQGLTHYSLFVSAAVLKGMNANIKESIKFSSPNYHLFLGLMSRVILQNPELYAQIQLSNPGNRKVWKAFKKESDEFYKLCSRQDLKALVQKIIGCAQEFKGQESCLFESDEAVNAINYLIESLANLKSQHVLVENRETGKFHYGTLLGLEDHEIVVDELGKKTRISLAKARLASKKEMHAWRKSNLKQLYLDYSFLVPLQCSKKIIGSCLSRVKECKFGLLDEYKGEKIPEGKKSLTFRATFFEDSKREKIDNKIRKTIEGLGFQFR